MRGHYYEGNPEGSQGWKRRAGEEIGEDEEEMKDEETTKQVSGADLDPKVDEVYRLLIKYATDEKRDDWVTLRDKCWDAIENKILTDKDKKELKKFHQEPLEINQCVKGVQGSSAIVTDQKPEIKVYPVGSGDLYVAELLKRGHDLVWTRNEGNDVTYEIVEEVNVGGLSFFDVRFDRNLGILGRIVFEEADPEDIYFDSQSKKKDFSDTHIIKAKQRTKQYIKEHYPDISEKDMEYKIDIKDSSQIAPKSEGITGGDNYPELGKKKINPDDEKKPKIVWEIEAWLLKTEKEDWIVRQVEGQKEPEIRSIELTSKEKKGLNAGDKLKDGIYWPRQMQKRVHRIIVGKKLIEEHENPHGVDRDGNPVIGIIGLKGQRTRSAYPMSKTAYAVDINRDMIKRRLQFNMLISQNANAPIIQGQGVNWDGPPGSPGSTATVSASNVLTPTRLQPGAIEAQLFIQAENKDVENINDEYDLHDVMRGKIPEGTDPSGRVVLALQDMGGMMSKPSLRALEACLIRLAKVDISLMLRHWPRFMWEKLIEPDEWRNWRPEDKPEAATEEEISPEMQDIITAKWNRALDLVSNPDLRKRISLLDLDIKLVAGSSMPTNRIARSMLAMEKVKAGIYDAEAALEYDDDPNKDKIIARMKEREKAAMEAEMMKSAK